MRWYYDAVDCCCSRHERPLPLPNERLRLVDSSVRISPARHDVHQQASHQVTIERLLNVEDWHMSRFKSGSRSKSRSKVQSCFPST
jgi:hypothetical protein